MERIRQDFTRGTSRVLLVVTLLLTLALVGCRKEIPEDKARAIFTEVAEELIKRPDANDAAKSAMVDAVCEKHGFVRKDLQYLLKMQPEAKAWLEEALKAEVELDLDAQREQWEKRLAKARQKNQKNAADLEKDQGSKFVKIEQDSTRKLAEIDQTFEASEQKLKAQIEALQKALGE